MHKATVIGHLGADPEMRYLPSGERVTSFSLASSYKYRDAGGESREETTWFSVSVFGKMGEAANEYLKKGSQCFVSGRFRSRSFVTKEGDHRVGLDLTASEVQFLDSANRKEAAAAARESFVAQENDYQPV